MLITVLQIHQGIVMLSNNLAQLIAEPTHVTFLQFHNTRFGYHKLSGAFYCFRDLKAPIQLRSLCYFRKYESFHLQKSVVQKACVEFNNANIIDFNWELSQLDLISLCENTNDIDEIYSSWYSHFRSIIEKYIPLKTVTIRPNEWIAKCALQFGGGTDCFEFIANVHLQSRGNATGLNATL